MEDRYIVAIDLGTSKIALAVANAEGDGARLVYYKETPADGMRCGRILNEAKATVSLKEALRDAEDILGIKITGAVTAMPRFYVRTEENSASTTDREPDSQITVEEIEALKSFARDSNPVDDTDSEAVYGVAAQSFSTDEDFQLIEDDVIGMSGKVLEGNFKIFIGKKSPLNRIDRVMKAAEIVPLRKYFAPQVTADSVLFPTEKDNGVALIDFGCGCTSVSIYYRNVLRFYSSIPFGGGNITNDIHVQGNIPVRLAENIKLAYGACMPDNLQNLSEKQLLIKNAEGDADKRLSVSLLSEIVTAREEEILRAIIYEIGRSKFADKLQSGIVITGGAAQMTNLGNFITELSGCEVRIGRPRMVGIINGCTGTTALTATTAIGLAAAGIAEEGLNCACPKDCYVGTEVENHESGDRQPTEQEREQGILPGMGDGLEDGTASVGKKKKEKTKKEKPEKPGFIWKYGNLFAQWIDNGLNDLSDTGKSKEE